MLATLPATMMTAMASPMARPMPSTMEAAMPLEAAGTLTRNTVSIWVAPGPARPPRTLGHRLEGSLGYGDDGGQNHDGQHQNGAEQAGAVGQVEGHSHRRHQNHHADETVHHGRDARQQIHCRAHQAGQTGRRYLGQEHCGHEAHRYAQDNGPGGAVDGGKDEGQYAEFGLGGGGGPLSAEEEVHQPDLADGGQAGHDQVDTDEEDKDDRDQTADKTGGS